ncbi:mucin-5AC, partial [Biomphalaria glabrata]
EVPGYGGSLNDLDFTLDHLLPLEYFGSQYVSFPSPQLGPSQSNVTFKIIALHNNSKISIFGEKIEGASQVTLRTVGEVVVLELSSAYFYYFNSSKNFHISLTHSLPIGNVSAKSVCTASLIPVQLWRLQYDFETMPDTVIYIVVETDFENLIEINNISKPESVLKCTSILGSNWSGCTYKVEDPKVTLYQVRIKYHQHTLGVYTYVYDQIYNTSMCTAVGLSDDYRPLNVFLDEEYINSQYNFSGDTEPPYQCKLPSTPPTPTVASLETVKQIRQEIVKNLTVAKLNTSSFRRTKESIQDYRPLSNAIGYSGIIMITLVFVVVCGYDVATAAITLVTWMKSLKM